MIHYMKLNSKPFYKMARGNKTIELRLNDKKRQKVQIDDIIEFSNTIKQNEIIRVKVIKLHTFANFDELYKALPLDKCGYSRGEVGSASPKDMEEYYSIEKQSQYGVLGIEFLLL